MVELIDLYFAHANLLLPILHRPTFEKGISNGLHHQSIGFGGVTLLICAIGSRFSDDSRVFLPEANSEHSAGWKWFDQVLVARKSRLAPPSLYDLQKHCVSVRPILSKCPGLIRVPVVLHIFARFIRTPGVLDDDRDWDSTGNRRWGS
jgi:hypothetical protein